MSKTFVWVVALATSVSACTGPVSDSKQHDESVAARSSALGAADFRELRPAGDPAGPANFGWSVAVDGARVLVGANRVAATLGSEGAAYVLDRQSDGSYTQSARLHSLDLPAQAAQFGYSVALKGDVALVGAPYFDGGGVANPGAAFLYERASDGTWAQQPRLQGAAQPNQYFGYAVALGDDSAFIGGWGYNRVYVYQRVGSTLTPGAVLSPPDAVLGDRFGAALAVDGTRLVVGAPFASSEAGAVYIYEQEVNGSWTLHAKLQGPNPSARFGRSVAIAGDTVLVGGQDLVTSVSRGAAGDWVAGENLTAPATGFDYGNSLALTSDYAIVGAYLEDTTGKKDVGAVYLFRRNAAGTFAAAERVLAPAPGATDYFGYSVAASAGRAVIGAYGDDDVAANGGAAYAVDLGVTPSRCEAGSPCARAHDLLTCGTYRLAASQTANEEGDLITLGNYEFGRRAKFKVPASVRITSGVAGTAAFLYFRDPARQQDVRCRYSPATPGATSWSLDGCKIPRAGIASAHAAGDVVEASEVRFRLGGGDALRNGPSVAGDIDLVEAGACNAFAMDDCTVARSTADRFSLTAERFEQSRLDRSYQFTIPSSVPVISPAGAALGQQAELSFWSGNTRTTVCNYKATTAGTNQLAFTSCSAGFSSGNTVGSNKVVLRVLSQGFSGKPVQARVTLGPLSPSCISASDDADGDGIPTLTELAQSRAIGVADVDRDGLPNWRDADANGDGIPDSVQGIGDTDANGVPDAFDEPCEPTTWYADADGDGFGDSGSALFTCPAPDGYVANAEDCNDADAAINPNATEICGDGLDNDCDTAIDETCTPACPAAPIQPQGTILSQLQAGHGFTANAGGSQNLNDTVDYAVGTQSAWIESNGTGGAKTLKKTNLGTYDFTGKMPRLWLKLDSPTNASTLQLYLGNNNLADQYKFSFNSTQGQQWTTDGDWVAFSMSWSNKTLSKVGNPNRAAITDVQLRAIDTATGNPVKLHINQFSMVDEPVAYPDGVVSFTFDDGYLSQYTLAKAILDGHSFPATAYVIVGNLGTTNYMTVPNLTDLHANSAWEIAYHAYDPDVHSNGFPATPQPDLEQDIDLGRDWLYQNGFDGYCDCAYPSGEFTGATDVLGTVHPRLAACRTIHQKHREAFPPSDPYKLRVLLVTLPVTVDTVKAALDQAKLNKEWIILVFHNLTNTPVINDDYDPDDFQSIADYVNTIGMPVKTVGQMLSLP